jgi:hypothetical protein
VLRSGLRSLPPLARVGYSCLSRSALVTAAVWMISQGPVPLAHAFPGLADKQTHPPPSSGPYAYETFTPAAPNFPALGQSYIDPVFGSEITRISDIYPGTGTTGSGIIYGVNGLWSINGSYYLHDGRVGVDVINPATGAVIRTNVPYPYTTTDAVSFDPADDDSYYYTAGTQLKRYRISSGQSSLVKTFNGTLGGLGQSADWIDRTGTYFLLNLNGSLRIWNKQSNQLYSGSIPVSGIPPGWAGLSPDGKYVITSLNPKHYSYKIDHTNRRLITSGTMFWDACYDHGDVMTASDGKTYFITGACLYDRAIYRVDVTQNASGKGAAQLTMPGNVRLLPTNAPGVTGSGHFGCAALGAYQDWCYASEEDAADKPGNPGSWYPYKQEIVFVHMLAPYEVYRLAHHRARPTSDYCRTPRVNANWDGSKAAFTSNMSAQGNGAACGYSDLYVIDLGQ